jgi:hypothetical protein
MFRDDPLTEIQGSLRTRIQPECARHQHDALQEHAVIKPGTLLHAAIGDEGHADRSAEELKIAAKLPFHAGFAVACDAKQRVQRPVEFTPSSDEGRHPLVRVISKLLFVQPVGVVAYRENLLRECIMRFAFQHVTGELSVAALHAQPDQRAIGSAATMPTDTTRLTVNSAAGSREELRRRASNTLRVRTP